MASNDTTNDAPPSQKELKLRLKAVANLPENQLCCDCGDKKPTWASLIVPPPDSPTDSRILGAFCCFHCSGAHRRLGVHICFVRSVTLDDWKEKEVLALELGGNQRVNKAFEAKYEVRKAEGMLKPHVRSNLEQRDAFIMAKYSRRVFFKSWVYREIQDDALSDLQDGTLERRWQKLQEEQQAQEAERLRQQQQRRANQKLKRLGSVANFSQATLGISYDDLFAGEQMDMFSDSKRDLFQDMEPANQTSRDAPDADAINNYQNNSNCINDNDNGKSATADVQTFNSMNDSTRMIEVTQFVVQDVAPGSHHMPRRRSSMQGSMSELKVGSLNASNTQQGNMKQQVMDLNNGAEGGTNSGTTTRMSIASRRSSLTGSTSKAAPSGNTSSRRPASARNVLASTAHDRNRDRGGKPQLMRRSSTGGGSSQERDVRGERGAATNANQNNDLRASTHRHRASRRRSNDSNTSGSRSPPPPLHSQNPRRSSIGGRSQEEGKARRDDKDDLDNKSVRSSSRRRPSMKDAGRSVRQSRRNLSSQDNSTHHQRPRSRSRSVRAKGRSRRSSANGATDRPSNGRDGKSERNESNNNSNNTTNNVNDGTDYEVEISGPRNAQQSSPTTASTTATTTTKVLSKSASMRKLSASSTHTRSSKRDRGLGASQHRRGGSSRPPSRNSSFDSTSTDNDDCASRVSSASSRRTNRNMGRDQYSGAGSVCSNSNDYYVAGSNRKDDDDDDDRSRYSRASTASGRPRSRSRSRSRRGTRRNHHAASRMVLEANSAHGGSPGEQRSQAKPSSQRTMKRSPSNDSLGGASRHSTRRQSDRSKPREGMDRSMRRRRSNGEWSEAGTTNGAPSLRVGGNMRRSRSMDEIDNKAAQQQQQHDRNERNNLLGLGGAPMGVDTANMSRADRARLRRSQRQQNGGSLGSSEHVGSTSRRQMQRHHGLPLRPGTQTASNNDLESLSVNGRRRGTTMQRSRSSADQNATFSLPSAGGLGMKNATMINANNGRAEPVKKRSALSSSTLEWLAREEGLVRSKLNQRQSSILQDEMDALKADQSTSAETLSSNSSIES